MPDELILETLNVLDPRSLVFCKRSCCRFHRLGLIVEEQRKKRRELTPIREIECGYCHSLCEFNGLLAVGGKNEITLWNKEGKCVKRLVPSEGEEWWGSVCALVEFDGKLAAGSGNGKIRLWARDGTCATLGVRRLSENAERYELRGHSGGVRCLCVFGDLLASGSLDRTIKLWDKAGTCVTTLFGHRGPVLSLTVFEGLLASGSEDRSIKMWDASGPTGPTGTCVRTLTGHEIWVWCLCVFAGLLVSGSDDKTLRFWDSSGNCVKVLTGHPGWITGLASSGCGDLLVSACTKDTKIWNVEGECLRTITRSCPPYDPRPLLFWKGMLVETLTKKCVFLV